MALTVPVRFLSYLYADGPLADHTVDFPCSEAEHRAFERCNRLRLPTFESPELKALLDRAWDEIGTEICARMDALSEEAIKDFSGDELLQDWAVEEVLQNEPCAALLQRLGLAGKTREEINAWKVASLGKRLTMAEFDPGFRDPATRYEQFEIMILIDDCYDPLHEPEARETLKELFGQRFYTRDVRGYVQRAEEFYEDGSLADLAKEVARELGKKSFRL